MTPKIEKWLKSMRRVVMVPQNDARKALKLLRLAVEALEGLREPGLNYEMIATATIKAIEEELEG